MKNATIKPPRLRAGDTVAAVSLSWGGPGAIPHRYLAGKRQFEQEFGIQVLEMPNTLKSPEWLSRNPQARAEDLMQAFTDPTIKAVVSTIGGEDSIRLLPYVDLKVLRNNPKIFCGYSDSTVTHFMCAKAGVTSLYGPSFMSGFGENCGMHRYLADSFRQLAFSAQPVGPISPNMEGWTVEFLNWEDPANLSVKRTLQPCTGWKWLQGKGVVRGPLLGGCIEVVDWLRGTELWPEQSVWDGSILFFETSEEAIPPLTLKRLLRVLGACGSLQKAKALLFGRPGGFKNPASSDQYDKAILSAINEELGLTHLPIITDMDFGHTDPLMTIPYGIEAQIDCDAKVFSICEAAVS
ncbi:MAG: LD-carboxypeptidase [Deltaproteobacteria bacterium]|nr:LD-carboxypeptidase [Deltaproteobacteria bacterium]